MTKDQYFAFAEKFFAECQEISKRKNADYTGGNADPFSNFQAVEVLGISTEAGFLTRMMDKMKRIGSFVEQGQLLVKDESVLDTLHDLANYACLLAGYIESKKKDAKPVCERCGGRGYSIDPYGRPQNCIACHGKSVVIVPS